MKCDYCDSELYYKGDRCCHCWEPLEAPNVRWAKKERSWLKKRYKKAKKHAKKKGHHKNLVRFRNQVRRAVAVINLDIDFLYSFITNEEILFSTYQKIDGAEARKPKSFNIASQRLVAEASLFAEYGKEIRYAALSLNGKGLSSYGNSTIILDERYIKKRATALETDSIKFLKLHPKKPKGYVSTWHEKYKLAVAKYANQIEASTTENQFEDILLFSEGDRSTEEFIEVHIYGPISLEAVKEVRVTSCPKGRQKGIHRNKIKEVLTYSLDILP